MGWWPSPRWSSLVPFSSGASNVLNAASKLLKAEDRARIVRAVVMLECADRELRGNSHDARVLELRHAARIAQEKAHNFLEDAE